MGLLRKLQLNNREEFLSAYSPWQFTFFRVIFGIYLALHFATLIPYGGEVWSGQGMIPDPTILPTYNVFPNVLNHLITTPAQVTAFLAALTALSLLYTAGAWRRVVSVVLWYGWACLLNRNIFIANPSLPYVGWIILASAFIPEGEPLSATKPKTARKWEMNHVIFLGAWLLLAVGYTVSGVHKAFAESWRDGTALIHVINLPTARANFLRDLIASLPVPLLKMMTWGSLGLEILFAPLCLIPALRPWVFTGILGMQFGILGVISITDLTTGMLMTHLFTVDPRWLTARRSSPGEEPIVFFDGVCGLCDRFVGFLLTEDRQRALRVATLQGPVAAAKLGAEAGDPNAPTSVVLYDRGRVFKRTDAVFRIVAMMGGIWKAAWLLLVVPRPLRDWGYDFVAARRYQWFGRKESCRLPTPAERAQFLG